MIISKEEQNIINQDSARQIQDTSLKKIIIPADTVAFADSVIETPLAVKRSENPDIITISLKNPVGDIIYSDNQHPNSEYFQDNSHFFPFGYLGITGQNQTSSSRLIISHLKEGKEIPQQQFTENWIILLVVISAFIYSSISAYSGKQLNNIKAFLIFKGIGDQGSRERVTFSHWNIILLNLVSFVNISLLAYLAFDYNDFDPFGISGISLWIILLALVTIMVTLRKVVCSIIGNITDETALFGEYCSTVYQSYHVYAFICFILSILLAYTDFLNPGTLLISGIIFFAAAYIMRILRLFLIFMKRNISILYLILYLCALEFLPVLIVSRYLTNLF